MYFRTSLLNVSCLSKSAAAGGWLPSTSTRVQVSLWLSLAEVTRSRQVCSCCIGSALDRLDRLGRRWQVDPNLWPPMASCTNILAPESAKFIHDIWKMRSQAASHLGDAIDNLWDRICGCVLFPVVSFSHSHSLFPSTVDSLASCDARTLECLMNVPMFFFPICFLFSTSGKG